MVSEHIRNVQFCSLARRIVTISLSLSLNFSTRMIVNAIGKNMTNKNSYFFFFLEAPYYKYVYGP